MKTNRFSKFAFCLFAAAALFQSCSDLDSDHNDMILPTAVVTVKPINNGDQFIMQLDNKTILQPTNLTKSPFGKKEVRALVNYTETVATEDEVRNVNINWIDSIRTKGTVPNLGAENDEKYGHDPIEIVNDWLTVAEDGYLTLRFRTLWGYGSVKHNVNILTDVNPENPYELELRHDANGDLGGEMGDALIAFNLKELPASEDNNVKIKLNWKSFSGDKSVEFDLYIPSDKPSVNPEGARYNGCVN